MAKMNDLEVKGVKYFPDHEGAMVPYGNIYFKGKKVGSFRSDGWSGLIHYDHTHKTITEEEVMEAFHGIVEKLGWDKFYDNFEILIDELIEFKNYESIFKKLQKESKVMILIRTDYSLNPMEHKLVSHTINPKYYSPVDPTESVVKQLANKLKEEHPKGHIYIFRDLDDFIF